VANQRAGLAATDCVRRTDPSSNHRAGKGRGREAPTPAAQSPVCPPPVKGPLRRYAPWTDSPQTYTGTYGEDARREADGAGEPSELCCFFKSRAPGFARRQRLTDPTPQEYEILVLDYALEDQRWRFRVAQHAQNE
jgi:hypothetical protein